MAHARANGMKQVTDLQFGQNPETGAVDTRRMVAVENRSGDPHDVWARNTNMMDMDKAQQTPAAQSYQSFDAATQNLQAQELAREQARQMEMQMQQGRGVSR
jgi:hypothetical protein